MTETKTEYPESYLKLLNLNLVKYKIPVTEDTLKGLAESIEHHHKDITNTPLTKLNVDIGTYAYVIKYFDNNKARAD